MRLIDADVVELKLKDDFRSNKIGSGLFMDIMQYLKEAKSIEAEPTRHGKWIKIGMIENTWAVHRCSACGYQTIDNGQYCTECGAKMDEVKE